MQFFIRVFAPFALGYFLSYALRTVNAIIAPQLTAELGLTGASLGFLTAGYFLAFAMLQVPLGIWLDKYPPRKVEATLLVVGAIGSFAFAAARSLEMLVIARALIGAGVCCCLMASFRCYGQWLPKERLPFVNGLQLAVGSIGAISATLLAQSLLPSIGWRGLFVGMGVALLVASIWLWFATPDPQKSPQKSPPIPAAQKTHDLVSTRESSPWKHPVFWTLMPFAALNVAHGMSMQGLWASPWLLDVASVPKAALGSVLVMISIGMLIGNLCWGALATRLAAYRILPHQVGVVLCVVALFAQLPFVVGGHAMPAVALFLFGLFNSAGTLIFSGANHFFAPQVLGRVYAAFNLSIFLLAFFLQWLTGVVVSQFPKSGGGYGEQGYQIAFAAIATMQLLALLGYFALRKNLKVLT